jgi:hypothetical protein
MRPILAMGVRVRSDDPPKSLSNFRYNYVGFVRRRSWGR